jgi:hypothetical protein
MLNCTVTVPTNICSSTDLNNLAAAVAEQRAHLCGLKLNEITNVEVPTPADGEALVYNAAQGKWVASTVAPASTGELIKVDVPYSPAELVDNAIVAGYDPTFTTGIIFTPPAGTPSTGNVYTFDASVLTYLDGTAADFQVGIYVWLFAAGGATFYGGVVTAVNGTIITTEWPTTIPADDGAGNVWVIIRGIDTLTAGYYYKLKDNASVPVDSGVINTVNLTRNVLWEDANLPALVVPQNALITNLASTGFNPDITVHKNSIVLVPSGTTINNSVSGSLVLYHNTQNYGNVQFQGSVSVATSGTVWEDTNFMRMWYSFSSAYVLGEVGRTSTIQVYRCLLIGTFYADTDYLFGCTINVDRARISAFLHGATLLFGRHENTVVDSYITGTDITVGVKPKLSGITMIGIHACTITTTADYDANYTTMIGSGSVQTKQSTYTAFIAAVNIAQDGTAVNSLFTGAQHVVNATGVVQRSFITGDDHTISGTVTNSIIGGIGHSQNSGYSFTEGLWVGDYIQVHRNMDRSIIAGYAHIFQDTSGQTDQGCLWGGNYVTSTGAGVANDTVAWGNTIWRNGNTFCFLESCVAVGVYVGEWRGGNRATAMLGSTNVLIDANGANRSMEGVAIVGSGYVSLINTGYACGIYSCTYVNMTDHTSSAIIGVKGVNNSTRWTPSTSRTEAVYVGNLHIVRPPLADGNVDFVLARSETAADDGQVKLMSIQTLFTNAQLNAAPFDVTYANDGAAATGGVPVGYLYIRTTGELAVRLT